MKVFLLQIALFGAVAYGAAIDEAEATPKEEFTLPEGIPTCIQSDTKLNDCLKDVFQQMIPKLHNGLKSLNIPPIDPFAIESSNYRYSNGAIQGRLALKNAKVYGMSRGKVQDVRFNIEEEGTKLEVDMYMPRIFIEGSYKADVKFNDIKMNPKGYFNITMTDVKTTQKMEGKFETAENGNRFIRLTKFDMDPDVGDMKIYASGLFPDPTLNAVVLDFVNQYWREIYKIMLPETRVYWEPMMLEAANKFLLNVPFDKLITKN